MKKTNFRNTVSEDSNKRNSGTSNYGYLNLSKGVNLFKEKAGSIHVDFLPYEVSVENHPDLNTKSGRAEKGSLWYKLPFKTHRNVGVNNDAVVCPTTFGHKCPICEYRAKRVKEGAEKEELDALRPAYRCLYVVMPIGDKDMKEVPHVWDKSEFLFQKLLDKEIGENEEMAIFPDLEEGLTLKLRFEEKAFAKNKFFEVGRIDFVKRDYVHEEAILDEIPCLDNLLNILSYKELEMKMMDLDDSDIEKVKQEPEHEQEKETPPTRRLRTQVEEKPKEEPKEETTPPTRTRRSIEPPVEEKTPEKTNPPVTRRSATPPAEQEKPKASNGCPHGHEFGADCDKFDECAACTKWDSCIEAQ